MKRYLIKDSTQALDKYLKGKILEKKNKIDIRSTQGIKYLRKIFDANSRDS